MDVITKVKELNKIEFNPMQLKAIEIGLFDSNLIISSPTASGKTLIADLTALNSVINNKKKVICVCPLKALASEHFNEFKKKYSNELNIKTTISTGDYDSGSKYLSNYDVIFTTYEKAESLLRHKSEWLKQIGLLVVDEIHEIDSDRGPVIEILITKLLLLNPKIQILGLSATIPNAKELSSWLDAKLVESSFRPVKLNEGVFFENQIHFLRTKEKIASFDDPLISLSKDTLKKQKQALIFCNTRPRSIATAKKLAKTVEKTLLEKERMFLSKKSDQILNTLENPTEQCRILSDLVKSGVAFHNAGLLQKQRTIIEDLFRSNSLKIISATPTLCLVPETSVWQGVQDEKISSFGGKNQRLLAVKSNKLISIRPKEIIKNENSRKIVELESVCGFSVKLTDNHRVWVKRDRKKILLPAAKCKKGDKIAVVGKLKSQGAKKFKLNYFTLDLPETNKFPDEDFFYFLGSMLGDGYSGIEINSKGFLFKGSPCLTGNDSEIFAVAKRFCKKHKLHFRETNNSYGIPTLFFSKTKWFRMLLANCGVLKGQNKFIANELKQAKKSFLVSLIQGLFDTDGCVEKRGNISFSNISLVLIKDLQRLLLLFGIVSNLRERKGKTMNITGKVYNTKKHYELIVCQKNSVLNFHKEIGFRVERKQESLNQIFDSINNNIHYVECADCNYKIFRDLFSGRNKQQKSWGKQKLNIIKFLGKNKNGFSCELAEKLNFVPYKGEKRLDHHFELIKRTRVGNRKEWKLNEIGQLIYRDFISKSKDFDSFFNVNECPICKKTLFKKIKNGWREEDFEGDIFWDFISKVKKESGKNYPFVYDVVLPSNDSNDHLFVAEGFLVHNSAGINMPAFRVIIPSVFRYTALGQKPIPIREYKQMVGRCVSGETILFKENGLPITIEEFASKYFNKNETGSKNLKKDKKVLSTDLNSFTPKFASVQKIWKRKVNKLVEIETKSGKKIRVSEDHPLLSFTKIACGKASLSKVNDDREALYKKTMAIRQKTGWGAHKIAKELNCLEKESRINHWIIDGNKPLLNPFKWKKAKNVKKGKNYVDTDYLSSLADFGVGVQAFSPRDFLPYNNIVQINKKTFMNKQGRQKCDFPKEWSENLCRFIAKIMSDGNIYYSKKENSYQLRYYNKHLKVQKEYQKICLDLFNKKPSLKWRRGAYQAAFKSFLVGKFLENIGVPSGKKSFVLRVPKPIFSLPKNLIKSFIREYSFCDGWEDKIAYWLVTSSKKLAYDFALLLSSIGYLARVHKKGPNTFRDSDIWNISVTKSQFDNDKKLNSVGNIFPDLIKRKKIIKGDFYVYDLTLNPTHNFVANGLVIHNSGRPGYDTMGESILIASNEDNAEQLKDEFILGDLEEISSKLGIEPVLRMHILAAIASGFAFDLESLEKFFSKTFYAFQFDGLQEIFLKINSVLTELKELKFIEGNNNAFNATPLGKRIAELYLDPLTAKAVLDAFERDLDDFSFLFLLCSSFEFNPLFSVPKAKEQELWAELNMDSEKLPVDFQEAMFSDVTLLKKYHSASLLDKWINEVSDESLRKEFNVQPGILRSKLLISDWLLYCFSELALISGKKDFVPKLSKLRKRMKYGVKKELLQLIELKSIGRVRSRKLFNAGITSISLLKKTSIQNLSGILGKEISFKIKKQLGQSIPEKEFNSVKSVMPAQTSLKNY